MHPLVGTLAPQFELHDETKTARRLVDYRGHFVLLYFYPKDDTPGCTTEACTLRDEWNDFHKLQVAVIGVSVDDVESHTKFHKKYRLPFPLLADPDHKVVERYGVWGKKKFMGREYEGTSRVSFLIDPYGVIVKVYDKVKPAHHAAEVLADVRILREGKTL